MESGTEPEMEPEMEPVMEPEMESGLEPETGAVVCKFYGCGRTVVSRGYCNTHYHQFRRGGWDETALRPIRERIVGSYSSSGIKCREFGCDSVAKSRGLCGKHYQGIYRSEKDRKTAALALKDKVMSLEGTIETDELKELNSLIAESQRMISECDDTVDRLSELIGQARSSRDAWEKREEALWLKKYEALTRAELDSDEK